jgi:peptide/nickel transport system substrate-binding protein
MPTLKSADRFSRRSLVRAGAGLSAGAAAMLQRHALAQEASPAASPVAAGPVTTSITREEYMAQVAATFPLDEPDVLGGQLIEGVAGDVTTLNPNFAADNFSLILCMNLFNALTRTSVVDGSDAPDLADYWTISADNLTFTFYLNPDATWHDGEPVTAHDVAFTYEKLLDPASLAVKTAEVSQLVKGFRAIDDHVFELVAKQPSPIFVLKATNMVYVMPKHIWEKVPVADWGTAPGSTGQDPAQVVGSGPFRFLEWVPGDHATIVRNETYWIESEIPYLDSYTTRPSAEPAAAVQSLINGELDLLTTDATQYGTVAQMSDTLDIYTWDSLSQLSYWSNLNPERTPCFTDKRVRQAMLYGIDRDLAAETIMNGLAVRADGVQPPLSNAYDAGNVGTIYTYDPDKAAQLLDEAGWIDTDGDGIREKAGVPFAFEYLYYQDDQLVPYFQEEWAKLGLQMTASKIPFDAIIDAIFSGNFDMLQVGWGWTNADGDQGQLYRCDAAVPNGFNMTSYCNADYDRLNDAQLLELDPVKRKALLVEQSLIVNDDLPFTILFFLKLAAAAQPAVRNYRPNGYLAFWSMNKMWLGESA